MWMPACCMVAGLMDWVLDADWVEVMSAERSNVEKDGIDVPVPAVDEPAEDLRRLGEALNARAKDVLAGTVARTQASKHVLDAAVDESFERICMASTAAVASWMSGEGLEAAREVGMETWHILVSSLLTGSRRCKRF
jgi:hypothetical protein